MSDNLFAEVEVPQFQQFNNGVLFPTVLFPKPLRYLNSSNLTMVFSSQQFCSQNPNIQTSQLSVLIEAIGAQKPWLESVLEKSGAILFRGFPVTSPSDFNAVVEAFGFPEMHYGAGAGNRNHVVGRVLTANEGPADRKINFHHEMSYSREYPTKLFFFCEVQPGGGGETAIVPSHLIYDIMKEKHPDFVAQLEEHGVIYARSMPNEDDLSSARGRTWKSTFSTNDKSVAEQRAAKLGMKVEWMEDDSVIAKMDALPAIRVDMAGRKTWFNILATLCKGPEEYMNTYMFATYGDGKALPRHAILDSSKIMDDECVAIPWQKGDILLVDNLAVLHSRLPLTKQLRRILVSLCK